MEENRKTGIDVIDAVPWGTHLCQFYQTKKEDLIDILVPYFKTGLENNEFCIWVTSELLGEKEAEEAMRKAVPNFPRYVQRGQMEILPHTEWYLKEGVFNRKRVLDAWIDKLNQALARGYDGMRVTGDMTWLEEKDWGDVADYEKEVNNVIGEYPMLAICTYPLARCGASKIIDVARNHQFALTRQAGKWVATESSEYRQLQHDLEERGKELECLYGVAKIVERSGITSDELYQEVVNLLPQGWQYPEIICAKITTNSEEFKTGNYKETEWKQSSDINVRGARIGTVEIGYLEARPEVDEGPFLREERQLIDAVARQLGGITERKQAGDWVVLKPKKSQAITLKAVPRRQVSSLQERFIRLGLRDATDQEIFELLFSQHHPQEESSKLVKECLKRFKNLRGILSASPQELEEAGLCSKCIFSIRILRELPAEFLKQEIVAKPAYTSSKEIFDYLCYSMRDLKKEVFKAVYLNSRNKIIDTVDLFEGTLNSISVSPREIVESAIKHDAAGLIFAHNHTSGNPAPSRIDKLLTRELVFVGNVIQIKVLDHIIIGGNSYFSFADEGLIQKYEDGFLNTRIRAFDDRVC